MPGSFVNKSEGRLVVYIAGPEVFLPNALDIGQAKMEICRRHGFDSLFPSNESLPDRLFRPENAQGAFHAFVAKMTKSDLIVANMTPFRGPSLDVGTAMEIGFMHARGVPVFAYTNVGPDYAARVGSKNSLVDSNGMYIEPFGLIDNLMCVGPTLDWGSVIVHDVPEDERFSDIRGFEECIHQAAERLLSQGNPNTQPCLP